MSGAENDNDHTVRERVFAVVFGGISRQASRFEHTGPFLFDRSLSLGTGLAIFHLGTVQSWLIPYRVHFPNEMKNCVGFDLVANSDDLLL